MQKVAYNNILKIYFVFVWGVSTVVAMVSTIMVVSNLIELKFPNLMDADNRLEFITNEEYSEYKLDRKSIEKNYNDTEKLKNKINEYDKYIKYEQKYSARKLIASINAAIGLVVAVLFFTLHLVFYRKYDK